MSFFLKLAIVLLAVPATFVASSSTSLSSKPRKPSASISPTASTSSPAAQPTFTCNGINGIGGYEVIKNGGFQALDARNVPMYWEFAENVTVVSRSNSPIILTSVETVKDNVTSEVRVEFQSFGGATYTPPGPAITYIRQNLTLCPEQNYKLSFFSSFTYHGCNVSIDFQDMHVDTIGFNDVVYPDFATRRRYFQYLGAGGLDSLTFSLICTGDQNTWFLDDVSLVTYP